MSKTTKQPKEPQTQEPEDQAGLFPGEAASEITVSREDVEAVKNRLEGLQKEKEETIALLQRLQADFDNFRRRNISVRQESLDEGAADFAKMLLPVVDNFERALQAMQDMPGNVAEGVTLVYRQLADMLQKQGISEIPAQDLPFDPNVHNAVLQEPCEGVESGVIVEVMQKGYRYKERILRHSMVKVAQ